jgi:hypothetical protein
MSITLGRAREDVNPPLPCVGEGVHIGSYSAGSVCVRIVDIVHVMVLRSVHQPSSWTLCISNRLGAAVSPTQNPIRTSLTFADGMAGVSMAYNISRPGVQL